jgi:uncharacterized membrane protein YkoI
LQKRNANRCSYGCVAAYKTGIYTTIEGKLNIALDKETGGAVDIRLKKADGKVLYSEHLGKNEKTAYRVRLNDESGRTVTIS